MANPQVGILKPKRSIWYFVGLGLLLRLMVDTSGQLFYPFVPVLAAGLGVSAITIGRLIGLQSIVGLVAPIFGNLADRLGYRKFMWVGLLAVGTGLILFATSQTILWTLLACIVLGLGFALFGPNLLAYLSANLPPERRSRGMGAVEMSWGLAGFVGVATTGLAIERWGWRPPLIFLGALIAVASFVVFTFPATEQDRPVSTTKPDTSFWLRSRKFFDLGQNRIPAWAAIAATTLTSFASSHLISSYGQWFFVEYGFDARALGQVAGILGLGGLVAIAIISAFGDRIGSLRGVKIGAFFGTAIYLILPLINRDSTTLIIGLVVLYFFYQFAIVNALILTSAQIPEQRGKMMTLGWALDTIGISLANLTGPPAYAAFGPWGLALPAGLTMFVLGLIMVRFGAEGPIRQEPSH